MRLLSRLGRKSPVGVDYEPLRIDAGMYHDLKVMGSSVERASANYHNATNEWMFGLGVFRNIRLDALHLVRLVSYDVGTVMDRTRDGGRNFVYRISARWYLGEREWQVGQNSLTILHTPPQLVNVLASDFDEWWKIYNEQKEKWA